MQSDEELLDGLRRHESELLFLALVPEIGPLAESESEAAFGVWVELKMLGNRLNRLFEIRALTFAPGCERAVINLQILIRHHKAFIREQLLAQSITIRTSAKGRVE